MTKIKLPEGNFKVENQTGDKKRIIIDFKFDEEHKDDFIKNHMYIFRFILNFKTPHKNYLPYKFNNSIL